MVGIPQLRTILRNSEKFVKFEKTKAALTSPSVFTAAHIEKAGPNPSSLKLACPPFDDTRFEYVCFQQRVNEEYLRNQESRLKEILRRINPINADNMDSIKTVLTSSTANEGLREKILSCTTPDELFTLLKKSGQNIFQSKAISDIVKKANETGVTPEMEKKYFQLCRIEMKKIRKIFNMLIPKSTQPEVLKIEENVRNLGIKGVNFSNDLEAAKLVEEAIKGLKKAGIPLPKLITVDRTMLTGTGGMAGNIKGRGFVRLQTTPEKLFCEESNIIADTAVQNTTAFKNGLPKHQEKFLNKIRNNQRFYYSTKNRKHAIFHEVAHAFQPSSLTAKTRKLTGAEMKIAEEISTYAASAKNGIEAMPEMFAKLMDGQSLTEEQMALYLKLGGILPKL